MSQKLTQAGYENLQQELQNIKKNLDETLVQLADARTQGDLSENFDYHQARERQAVLTAKIAELEHTLKTAIITNGLGVYEIYYVNLDKTVIAELVEHESEISLEQSQVRITTNSPIGQIIKSGATEFRYNDNQIRVTKLA